MATVRFRYLLIVLLMASSTAFAGARRRPASPVVPEPAAQWLDKHAIVLAETEANGGLDDLAPLASIVGNASVVGLGDGTHGTHEFYTTKLRILQFLIQQKDFDVLVVAGGFAQFERVNAYVQGGPGDVRQVLTPLFGEIEAFYLKVDEFAVVVEWMRNYNLTRGSKPAIEIFGAESFDGRRAAQLVVDYLRAVDSASVDAALAAYTCVTPIEPPAGCSSAAQSIREAIAAKEADYTARSSARRFADALQAATVVTQSVSLPETGIDTIHDAATVANVLWARDHRGTAKKIVYWAHDESLMRLLSEFGLPTPGELLSRILGSDYVNFASATWAGTFLVQWIGNPEMLVTRPFAPAGNDAYELFFHQSHHPAIVVPLRGDVHPFLLSPHHLRQGSLGEYTLKTATRDQVIDLRKRFDAIVFVDQTTPTHPLN